MSTPNQPPCRFRLDTTTSSTVLLPDGRKLGYAQFGTPNGAPIFFQHGFPGSRLEAAYLDRTATKVGARIIAIDRPGFGWSSPHPERTILSHATDTRALADHLKIQRFGVLGVSGGGPYALACARAMPADRLRAVSIVCGIGPPDMGYWGMKPMNWMGWTFGQRLSPALCRWWFSGEPSARLDLSDDERLKLMLQDFEKNKAKMDPKDQKFFGDRDWMRLHVVSARAALGQGMAASFSHDFRVLNADFGFKIEDIRKDLPIHLWYGTLDGNVPLQHGEKIAKRIGGAAKLRVEEETHASIFAERQEEYLGELVKALKE